MSKIFYRCRCLQQRSVDVVVAAALYWCWNAVLQLYTDALTNTERETTGGLSYTYLCFWPVKMVFFIFSIVALKPG